MSQQLDEERKVDKLHAETDRLSLAGEIQFYWVYVPGIDGRMYPYSCHITREQADISASRAGGCVLEEVLQD